MERQRQTRTSLIPHLLFLAQVFMEVGFGDRSGRVKLFALIRYMFLVRRFDQGPIGTELVDGEKVM